MSTPLVDKGIYNNLRSTVATTQGRVLCRKHVGRGRRHDSRCQLHPSSSDMVGPSDTHNWTRPTIWIRIPHLFLLFIKKIKKCLPNTNWFSFSCTWYIAFYIEFWYFILEFFTFHMVYMVFYIEFYSEFTSKLVNNNKFFKKEYIVGIAFCWFYLLI